MKLEALSNQMSIVSNNTSKVLEVFKHFGLKALPNQLKKLIEQITEEGSVAKAILPERFEATLPGGETFSDGEYSVRLTETEDKKTAGRILIFTAPELVPALKARYAENEARNLARKEQLVAEKVARQEAAEKEKEERHAREMERIIREREHVLLERGVAPSEELRNFLAQLPSRDVKIRYYGARKFVHQKYDWENSKDPTRVRKYGEPEGPAFAVAIDRGGWLDITAFIEGIDCAAETIKRLSLTAEEAEEIKRRRNFKTTPSYFDREIPMDILQKIVQELPFDCEYMPESHVFTKTEWFEFATGAIENQKLRKGAKVPLLLQEGGTAKYLTFKGQLPDGKDFSGVVPSSFDDEMPCAYVVKKGGLGMITVYLPE